MMLATAVLNQQAPAGGAFSPETDISWHSLFWAEGTAMTALGYSDTDPVSTWPNETGETDATEATSPPVFTASSSSFNDKPVVTFVSGGDKMRALAFGVAPDYTSGVTVVAVARTSNAAVSPQYLFDSSQSSTATYNRITYSFAAPNYVWGLQAGGSFIQSTPPGDTNAHLLQGFFDGSTGDEQLSIDGGVAASGNAGSGQLTGIVLGSLYNLNNFRLHGDIALVGIYEGDITADGNWSAFKSWVSTHYGITIV